MISYFNPTSEFIYKGDWVMERSRETIEMDIAYWLTEIENCKRNRYELERELRELDFPKVKVIGNVGIFTEGTLLTIGLGKLGEAKPGEPPLDTGRIDDWNGIAMGCDAPYYHRTAIASVGLSYDSARKLAHLILSEIGDEKSN
jgi:hypothetical protein